MLFIIYKGLIYENIMLKLYNLIYKTSLHFSFLNSDYAFVAEF